jgi:hypothetical protein
MSNSKKLALGSLLSIIGAFGIIVIPSLGWSSQLYSPWDFILGFLFGICAGCGAAVSIYALIQKRAGR